jgi:hypothetical protein
MPQPTDEFARRAAVLAPETVSTRERDGQAGGYGVRLRRRRLRDPGGAESYEHGGWTFEYAGGEDGDNFKLREVQEARASFEWDDSGAHLVAQTSIEMPEAPNSISIIGCDAANGTTYPTDFNLTYIRVE